MNITQTFYDNMAAQYDKLFLDWQAATDEQAVILDKIFRGHGFTRKACILDCACGIGTQAIEEQRHAPNSWPVRAARCALEKCRKKTGFKKVLFAITLSDRIKKRERTAAAEIRSCRFPFCHHLLVCGKQSSMIYKSYLTKPVC
jgi:SAM-dependent methyltransferase